MPRGKEVKLTGAGHRATVTAALRARWIVPTCVAWALGFAAWAQEIPQPLRDLVENRLRMRTAQIEWSHRARAYGGHERFFTTRFSEEEDLLVNRGEEDGAFRGPDGSGAQYKHGAQDLLRTNEGPLWAHEEETCNFHHYARAAPVPCLRALAVMPGFPWRDVPEALLQDPVAQASPRSYEERVEGDLHVVAATTDLGLYECGSTRSAAGSRYA